MSTHFKRIFHNKIHQFMINVGITVCINGVNLQYKNCQKNKITSYTTYWIWHMLVSNPLIVAKMYNVFLVYTNWRKPTPEHWGNVLMLQTWLLEVQYFSLNKARGCDNNKNLSSYLVDAYFYDNSPHHVLPYARSAKTYCWRRTYALQIPCNHVQKPQRQYIIWTNVD